MEGIEHEYAKLADITETKVKVIMREYTELDEINETDIP